MAYYPLFFDNNKDSVHSRYNHVLADVLDVYNHDKRLVELAGRLVRPLKLWQEEDGSLCFHVSLENAKHIKLYKEVNKDVYELVFEKELEKVYDVYNGVYKAENNDNTIIKCYFLEVETVDGLVFRKGYPENHQLQGNVFDHDQALDNQGQLYQIPRRKNEHDYTYETRIKDYLKRYGYIPLPVLELERILKVKPVIKGRWDMVARMDIDVMDPEDEKYMASNEYNSSVYGVRVDSKESEAVTRRVLEGTMPLGSYIIIEK
jgi:hypothetical protein